MIIMYFNEHRTITVNIACLLLVYIYRTHGIPDWIVQEKVAGYGDNLTLICSVDNCCSKPTGWIKYDPDYQTIFLDVRDSKSSAFTKNKYAASTNGTGFSLVIKQVQLEDLNIKYSCSYGFDQGKEKLLLPSDVFKVDEIINANFNGETTAVLTTLKRFKESDNKSKLPVAGIFFGTIIAAVIIFIATALVIVNSRKCLQHRCCIRKTPKKKEDIENCPLKGKDKPDKRADIIIIHTEKGGTLRKVKSFRSHLKKISSEMEYTNIRIELFEKVFTQKQVGSEINFQTVLDTCFYVFFYISSTFVPSKLKKIGLQELLFNDSRFLETPNSHPQIRIVRDCEIAQMPEDTFLKIPLAAVSFHYFDLNKMSPNDFEDYKKTLTEVLTVITEAKIGRYRNIFSPE